MDQLASPVRSPREAGYGRGREVGAPLSGSLEKNRPVVLLADSMRASIHSRLIAGTRLPSYVKYSVLVGLIQMAPLPLPAPVGSVHENAKLSRRRSFAVITICR